MMLLVVKNIVLVWNIFCNIYDILDLSMTHIGRADLKKYVYVREYICTNT